MNGCVFVTAQLGEVLQCLPLLGVELRRDFNLQLHMQIALSVALKARHAVSPDAKIASTLGACRNFQFHRAGESWDLDFAPQGCGDKRNRNAAVKIAAFPYKDGVFLKMDDDIEITGGTTARPSFASAAGTETRSLINPGWNIELNARCFFRASLTAAVTAWFVDGLSGSVTLRTGLGNLKESS